MGSGSNYKNLLLIDETLEDVDVIVNGLNKETLGILYKYSTKRSDILKKIKSNFKHKIIDRVAILCHEGEQRFLENGFFFEIQNGELVKNSNYNFLNYIISNYSVNYLDFLACNSLNYGSWKEYYNMLQIDSPNLIIGASDDDTGNIKSGGDWFLENTGEDIEDIYFSKHIGYYKHLFNSNLLSNETIYDPNDDSRVMSYVYFDSGTNQETLHSQSKISDYDSGYGWIIGLDTKDLSTNGNTNYDVLNANYPYLEISKASKEYFSGIISKGRKNTNQYTISYRVRAFSEEVNDWILISPSEDDKYDLNNNFKANENSTTSNISRFESIVYTNKIRIYPTSSNITYVGVFGLVSVSPSLITNLSLTDIIGNETSNLSLTFDNPLSSNVDLTPFISIDENMRKHH